MLVEDRFYEEKVVARIHPIENCIFHMVALCTALTLPFAMLVTRIPMIVAIIPGLAPWLYAVLPFVIPIAFFAFWHSIYAQITSLLAIEDTSTRPLIEIIHGAWEWMTESWLRLLLLPVALVMLVLLLLVVVSYFAEWSHAWLLLLGSSFFGTVVSIVVPCFACIGAFFFAISKIHEAYCHIIKRQPPEEHGHGPSLSGIKKHMVTFAVGLSIGLVSFGEYLQMYGAIIVGVTLFHFTVRVALPLLIMICDMLTDGLVYASSVPPNLFDFPSQSNAGHAHTKIGLFTFLHACFFDIVKNDEVSRSVSKDDWSKVFEVVGMLYMPICLFMMIGIIEVPAWVAGTFSGMGILLALGLYIRGIYHAPKGQKIKVAFEQIDLTITMTLLLLHCLGETMQTGNGLKYLTFGLNPWVGHILLVMVMLVTFYNEFLVDVSDTLYVDDHSCLNQGEDHQISWQEQLWNICPSPNQINAFLFGLMVTAIVLWFVQPYLPMPTIVASYIGMSLYTLCLVVAKLIGPPRQSQSSVKLDKNQQPDLPTKACQCKPHSASQSRTKRVQSTSQEPKEHHYRHQTTL